jgi:hypothetical protein
MPSAHFQKSSVRSQKRLVRQAAPATSLQAHGSVVANINQLSLVWLIEAAERCAAAGILPALHQVVQGISDESHGAASLQGCP